MPFEHKPEQLIEDSSELPADAEEVEAESEPEEWQPLTEEEKDRLPEYEFTDEDFDQLTQRFGPQEDGEGFRMSDFLEYKGIARDSGFVRVVMPDNAVHIFSTASDTYGGYEDFAPAKGTMTSEEIEALPKLTNEEKESLPVYEVSKEEMEDIARAGHQHGSFAHIMYYKKVPANIGHIKLELPDGVVRILNTNHPYYGGFEE